VNRNVFCSRDQKDLYSVDSLQRVSSVTQIISVKCRLDLEELCPNVIQDSRHLSIIKHQVFFEGLCLVGDVQDSQLNKQTRVCVKPPNSRWKW